MLTSMHNLLQGLLKLNTAFHHLGSIYFLHINLTLRQGLVLSVFNIHDRQKTDLDIFLMTIKKLAPLRTPSCLYKKNCFSFPGSPKECEITSIPTISTLKNDDSNCQKLNKNKTNVHEEITKGQFVQEGHNFF